MAAPRNEEPGRALMIPQAVQQQIAGMAPFVRHGERLDLGVFFDHPECFNVLAPTRVIQPLSPFYVAGLALVRLDPNPQAGDVYRDGKMLRPAKRGLFRISSALGINWRPELCGIVSESEYQVTYRVCGYIIGPDGVPKQFVGTKRIDLRALEREARFLKSEDAENGRPEWVNRELCWYPWKSDEERERWINRAVEKEMIQRAKNMLQLAETGAYLRAIRAIGQVKSNYTAEEIARPFVAVRTFLDPTADPDAIRESIRHSLTMRIETPVSPAAAIEGLIAAPVSMETLPEAPEEEGEVYEGEVPDDDAPVDPGRLL